MHTPAMQLQSCPLCPLTNSVSMQFGITLPMAQLSITSMNLPTAVLIQQYYNHTLRDS